MEEPSVSSFVFWMGTGAFPVGLYFLIARNENRKAGILVTFSGTAAALVTAREVKVFASHIAIVRLVGAGILLLTWGLLAYDIYLKRHPILPQAQAPSAQPNPSDLVSRWRKMVSDIQKVRDQDAAPLFAENADYPSLRPYLTDRVRNAIEGIQPLGAARDSGAMHPVVRGVLEDIDRVAREWNVDTQVAHSPDVVPEYPQEVFNPTITVEDPIPESNKFTTYKNKIRMLLPNVTGKEIHAWTPTWIADTVEAQVVSAAAPGSRFRLQGADGSWIREKQPDGTSRPAEYSCLELKPAAICDCYVGLLPRKGQNLKEMRRTGIPIGTALFALKIDGKLYFKRVRC